MKVINIRNVQHALPEGLRMLLTDSHERESRNGSVLVANGPVTTVYHEPTERVIFWPERDANPFFHFYEGLWMLAGRNDVESVEHFVGRMRSFSDDGNTLHGAYGHRWLHHFGMNQLGAIIHQLRENPEDRRCVLQMWDATSDLGRTGKDIPCNTHAYFSINNLGELEMTVCCRSNDMIWGAYGANAVHFSMLQEYIAAGVGVPVGRYWQISNNYHAYKEVFEKIAHLNERARDHPENIVDDPYSLGIVKPYPMVSTPIDQWRQDLLMYLDEGVVIGIRDSFFRRVAHPILMSHLAYKQGSGEDRYVNALDIIEQCHATDWKLAVTEWLQRRFNNYHRAQDNGVRHEE